jgi:signal transduction histidine kinase
MNNQSQLKSLLFAPVLLISFVFLFNALVFLFWTVEDVSDSEDVLVEKEAYYLTKLIEKNQTSRDSILIELKQLVIEKKEWLNYYNLVIELRKSDSLIYSSSTQNLKNHKIIYQDSLITWHYLRADFLHRSTYVIPYSFRKHYTIAWLSTLLIIASIITSRIFIVRNRRLNLQYQKQEEWTRMGRITSGLLHEIRNPLNAIKVNTQLVEEDILDTDLNQNDKQTMTSSLWSIGREIEHMDKLLAEFSDYSKPHALNFTRVNLNHILDSAVEFYKGECEKKAIKIRTRFKPRLPKISGDTFQLKRLFYNLITNAIQAMPNGGILKISTFYRANKIYINITDTGIGIPKRLQDQIFDEFYTTKEKGTGLGLAIANRIAENHSGKIKFRANRIKGTTFSIEIDRNFFL